LGGLGGDWEGLGGLIACKTRVGTMTGLLSFLLPNLGKSCTVFKIIVLTKFCYSPTDTQVNCLKTILKFTLKLTLKQLLHVSVQSPSSGSPLFELAKVTAIKTIN
jgi:hypothetical protein